MSNGQSAERYVCVAILQLYDNTPLTVWMNWKKKKRQVGPVYNASRAIPVHTRPVREQRGDKLDPTGAGTSEVGMSSRWGRCPPPVRSRKLQQISSGAETKRCVEQARSALRKNILKDLEQWTAHGKRKDSVALRGRSWSGLQQAPT